MPQVDVISVPFTHREMLDMDMALERDVTFIDGCIRTVKGSPHEDYYNKRRKRVTDLRNKVKVAMMCFVGQEGEG